MAILDLIRCDSDTSEDITMQAIKIIHQILNKKCRHIHSSRMTALLDVVKSLIHGRNLTVSKLGRSCLRNIRMKHAIKQSDRLIGNSRLYAERFAIYQAVAKWLIGCHVRPVILVDWSDYTYNRSHILLRAAIPVGGRSLTLYEEVHPYTLYANPRVQKDFLKALQTLIPSDCVPIVVTDAGFGGPWFKAVASLGWDYLGRLQKSVLCRRLDDANWLKCSDLFPLSGIRPRHYGEVELVRSNPLTCHLYLYHRRSKGRHKRTVYGHRARSQHSKKQAARESSPWMLASSFHPEVMSAEQLVKLYRTRMQIEESFRDIKNPRTGFSLTATRSRSTERLANLLLVGMLATISLWLIGRLAEEKQLHYQYQANTVRNKRVLSLFYLGCLLTRQKRISFTQQELKAAIKLVQRDILNQGNI